MSAKFGGGGNKCTICEKTSYPAETIMYEKKPYHFECFKCSVCSKKMEGASKASAFEGALFCKPCFTKGNYAQKQKNVVWQKKENTEGTTYSTKFGGGGTPCTICTKTVYAAETVSFDKKTYHAECFKCSQCDKKCTPSGAASFEDGIFCLKCFKEGGYTAKQAKTATTGKTTTTSSAVASKFGGGGQKCTECEKTVYAAESVSFDKRIYHAECFKCSTCTKKCTPSGAAAFEGSVFCLKCFKEGGYTQKQAATASSASTKTSNPLASKFGGGGNKCVRCAKTVYPAETVSYEKNFFHAACFTCELCDKKMTPAHAEGKKFDDGSVKVYCKKCWQEKGLGRADYREEASAEEEPAAPEEAPAAEE